MGVQEGKHHQEAESLCLTAINLLFMHKLLNKMTNSFWLHWIYTPREYCERTYNILIPHQAFQRQCRTTGIKHHLFHLPPLADAVGVF